MCFYIGIEDLAANALIEIMDMSADDKVSVSYRKLEDYGAKVVELLRSEKEEKAVLVLSRNNTNAFFHDYSDIFEETELEDGAGIRLKEGVSQKELIYKFRGYLAIDVLWALMDERSVQALGV